MWKYMMHKNVILALGWRGLEPFIARNALAVNVGLEVRMDTFKFEIGLFLIQSNLEWCRCSNVNFR